MRRRSRRVAGFSLIELMIALLIGSLLMSGVFNILVGAKQAYRVQDELSRTQENARFAADFIARDLRMAGFRGCRSGLPLNLMVYGADSDWRYNLLRPVQGYQGVANAPSELNAPFSNTRHDPDSVAVLTVNPDQAISIQSESDGELILAHTHDFDFGSTLLAANCDLGALFQVSSDSAGETYIKHEVSGGLSPGNCTNRLGGDCLNPELAGLDHGGVVMPLTARAYYLSTDINGVPGLYRAELGTNGTLNPEELVPGVEDFRLYFGIDFDADQVPNQYLRAGDSDFDPDQAISVQIHFLLRTLIEPDTQPKPYTFDGTTFTPEDGHVRREIALTIGLRNRL